MSSEQSPAPDDAAPDTSDVPPSTAAPATGTGPDVGPERAETSADEVEVESVVDPSTVRRAPRYGRFLAVGIVLGAVLGLAVGGAWLQSEVSEPVFKPGVYFTVILVTCAALGAAVAGLWAVIADRRSLRGRR